MRKILLCFFILTIGVVACQKDKDSPAEEPVIENPNNDSTKTNDSTKNNGGTKNNDYYVTATINGRDSSFILAECDTVYPTADMCVYGYTDSTKKKFIWFDINKRKIGTYQWTQMGFLDYPPNYGVDAYVDVEQTNIVTVTYLDEKVVEGTFSGITNNFRKNPATGRDTVYKTLNYTNGKFRAKLVQKD